MKLLVYQWYLRNRRYNKKMKKEISSIVKTNSHNKCYAKDYTVYKKHFLDFWKNHSYYVSEYARENNINRANTSVLFKRWKKHKIIKKDANTTRNYVLTKKGHIIKQHYADIYFLERLIDSKKRTISKLLRSNLDEVSGR